MKLDEFVIYLFDRPESLDAPWFYADDFLEETFEPVKVVMNASSIFQQIQEISSSWSEVQLVNGLNYLINPSTSDVPYYYFTDKVSVEQRKKALESMYIVFEKLFVPHCHHTFSSDQKPSSPLNSLCYMWWDYLPRHGLPYMDFNKDIDESILEQFKDILKLPNIACKESALHGLGHWQIAFPDKVEEIINKNIKYIPDTLRAYAQKALSGQVQ